MCIELILKRAREARELSEAARARTSERLLSGRVMLEQISENIARVRSAVEQGIQSLSQAKQARIIAARGRFVRAYKEVKEVIAQRKGRREVSLRNIARRKAQSYIYFNRPSDFGEYNIPDDDSAGIFRPPVNAKPGYGERLDAAIRELSKKIGIRRPKRLDILKNLKSRLTRLVRRKLRIRTHLQLAMDGLYYDDGFSAQDYINQTPNFLKRAQLFASIYNDQVPSGAKIAIGLRDSLLDTTAAGRYRIRLLGTALTSDNELIMLGDDYSEGIVRNLITGTIFTQLALLKYIRDLTINKQKDAIAELQDLLRGFENFEDLGGSNTWSLFNYYEIDAIYFFESEKPAFGRYQKSGGFFNKINLSKLPLKKYQIYNKEEWEVIEELPEHCLLATFRELKVPEAQIEKIKQFLPRDGQGNTDETLEINRNQFALICKELKASIVVHMFDGKHKSQAYEHCPNYEDKLHICLYNNHFFQFEPHSGYTSWYVDNMYNYNDTYKSAWVNCKKQWYNFPTIEYELDCNGQPVKDLQGKLKVLGFKHILTSLQLIDKLWTSNYFEYDPIISKVAAVKFEKSLIADKLQTYDLSNIHVDQQPFDHETYQKVKGHNEDASEASQSDDNKPLIYYIDTETENGQEHYTGEFKASAELEIKEQSVVEQSVIEGIKERSKHKAIIGGIIGRHNDDYQKFNFKRSNLVKRRVATLTKVHGVWREVWNITEEYEELTDGVTYGILEYIKKDCYDRGTKTMVTKYNKKTGMNQNSVKNIPKKAAVYAHNMKFDLHVLIKEMRSAIKCKPFDICRISSNIYSFKVWYRGVNIEFRDSFKLFGRALSEFQESFVLDAKWAKKDYQAYKLFRRSNYDKLNDMLLTEFFNYVDTPRLNYTNRTYIKWSDKHTCWTAFMADIIKNGEEHYGLKCPDKNDTNTWSFNPTLYYEYYLKHDVLLLKVGLEAFNAEAIQIFGVSIYNSLTISSLADKVVKLDGCYDGIYEICGETRKAAGQTLHGGMVQFLLNIQGVMLDEEMEPEGYIALDFNSLYPSAIVRLCTELGGLPTGPAIKFKGSKEFHDMFDAKAYNCFIVKIRITKVNKKQATPFIRHENGETLDYRNEPPDQPIWVNCITLEDWIKYQEIEYEFLEGMYWNSGVNGKIGELVSKFYDLRRATKEAQPGKAEVIKLFLNSIYGKTIMKYKYTKTKIVENDWYPFKNVVDELPDEKGILRKVVRNTIKNGNINRMNYNNFYTIKQTSTINEDFTLVEESCLDTAFTMPHIGSLILAMSKRILYEVLNLCNDLNIPVNYIDTDSIRVPKRCVNDLVMSYQKRYRVPIPIALANEADFNPELYCKDLDEDGNEVVSDTVGKKIIGGALGQFKLDLELKYKEQLVEDVNNSKWIKHKCTNVVIFRCIYVAKKMYLDIIRGIDHTGAYMYAYYKKAKGVTEVGLDYTCLTNYNHVYLKRDVHMDMLISSLKIKPVVQREQVVVVLGKDLVRMRKNLELSNYRQLSSSSEATDEQNLKKSKELMELILGDQGYLLAIHDEDLLVPGYNGDLMKLYQDICVDGVETNLVVPGGKPGFHYKFGQSVMSKNSLPKKLKVSLR